MNSYKTILKTTGLFASLRILSIFVNVATSKFIALFIGVSGIGLYGIFTSALSLLTTISDLGISKSSVRNIAMAEGANDKIEIEKTISLVSKLIYITGTGGALLTILFSFQISKWSFGTSSYWLSFVILGICVFFTIIKNGQTAILQGLREYRLITKSTIISLFLSIIITIPLVYFFKMGSIVYIILSGSIVSVIVTKIYLRKIKYKISENKIQLTKDNSKELFKLGISMMLVSFLVALSGYIIRAYINNYGSVKDLGFFQAGFQIVAGYFGIIFTSMTTDYFPRISAIQSDDKKLTNEVNQQANITLLLICPLVTIMPFLMPFLIKLLYSSAFSPTVEYVNIALFGIIFQAGSQTMGMILLAKNNSSVYLWYVFLTQLFGLMTNIVGYKFYGIAGLGITFSINMFIQLVSIQILLFKLYKIRLDKQFTLNIIIICILTTLSYLIFHYSKSFFVILAPIVVILSIFYTLFQFKRMFRIKSLRKFIVQKTMAKIRK